MEKTQNQTQAEKNGWHEVKPKPYSPCDGCEMGYMSFSQKVIDGVNYTKTEDCHDTCVRFRNWTLTETSRKEHFFGDNIRDAIKAIE